MSEGSNMDPKVAEALATKGVEMLQAQLKSPPVEIADMGEYTLRGAYDRDAIAGRRFCVDGVDYVIIVMREKG